MQTIERMGQLDPTYPCPVDVWRLGGLTWVFLGSEVTVDDSLRIKRNLGSATSSHGAHIFEMTERRSPGRAGSYRKNRLSPNLGGGSDRRFFLG